MAKSQPPPASRFKVDCQHCGTPMLAERSTKKYHEACRKPAARAAAAADPDPALTRLRTERAEARADAAAAEAAVLPVARKRARTPVRIDSFAVADERLVAADQQRITDAFQTLLVADRRAAWDLLRELRELCRDVYRVPHCRADNLTGPLSR